MQGKRYEDTNIRKEKYNHKDTYHKGNNVILFQGVCHALTNAQVDSPPNEELKTKCK